MLIYSLVTPRYLVHSELKNLFTVISIVYARIRQRNDLEGNRKERKEEEKGAQFASHEGKENDLSSQGFRPGR
jgi:hypothetical protein